ncbi:MAG: phosphate acyltransferase, partial [Vulcanimicrobiaceae bacterium]
RALGIATPKVAVLAATEEVNPAMQATVDARALRDRNREGRILGAIVDGPLAFDNAISREAARTKGIESPVCGDPDVLLVPTIEAGNMLYKEMVHFCGAITPGLVLGASAPIILTSRADPPEARLASCALAAAYLAHMA